MEIPCGFLDFKLRQVIMIAFCYIHWVVESTGFCIQLCGGVWKSVPDKSKTFLVGILPFDK